MKRYKIINGITGKQVKQTDSYNEASHIINKNPSYYIQHTPKGIQEYERNQQPEQPVTGAKVNMTVEPLNVELLIAQAVQENSVTNYPWGV